MIGIIIDNETNEIINRVVIELGSDWLPEEGTTFVLEPDDQPYAIGGKWVSGVYTPPAEPEPDPTTVVDPTPYAISDRQFYEQMHNIGLISEDDVLKAHQGIIPPFILGKVEEMPVEIQFKAKSLLGGATVIEFYHPMTIAFAESVGMDEAARKQFFIDASKL